jgi:hypothetical protein
MACRKLPEIHKNAPEIDIIFFLCYNLKLKIKIPEAKRASWEAL